MATLETQAVTAQTSHKYLREMNEKVLSKYRLITVGECPGVNAEQAKK